MTPDTINRLVFIKHLHTIARQQATQPEPLNATAILTLHATVDLFLQLTAEHQTTIKKPNGTFLGYWDTIKDQQGNPPTQRLAMERLNRARVNLKHAGIRPAREDVNGLLAATTLFLTENSNTFFTTTFEDIGLHHLIMQPQAREHLRLAATARTNNQPVDAVVNLGLALNWLIDDYRDTQRRHRSPQGTRLTLENRHRNATRELTQDNRHRELVAYVDHLTTMIKEMYDSHAMLSLGINYRDYNRFRTLTPGVSRTSATDPTFRYRVDIPIEFATYPYTQEELDFCTTFVITTGLNLTATPQPEATTP